MPPFAMTLCACPPVRPCAPLHRRQLRRLQRRADLCGVMVAVPQGVVLNEELAGERGVAVEREAVRRIQLGVAQLADSRGSRRAVAADELERLRLGPSV